MRVRSFYHERPCVYRRTVTPAYGPVPIEQTIDLPFHQNTMRWGNQTLYRRFARQDISPGEGDENVGTIGNKRYNIPIHRLAFVMISKQSRHD